MIGNIVEFCENATHAAARWCREHNLHGRIIDKTEFMVKVDVGLDYNIYALKDQIKVVSESGEISPLSSELKKSAPIPEDGGY